MDIALTPEDRAFQAEVRQFFAHEYPAGILEKLRAGCKLDRSDHIASQRALQARGWFGVSWPKEFGGPGWTPTQRYIFDEALETAGAPGIIPMAVIYIGPIICAFGTPDQQARWLPDILESRALWAQGYSEPEAGSDLASLRMTAVRDGDDYILDGTKIWTSSAHWADWIFCLVRTSAETRKQDGISLICADMRSPGITVHPIITIDGGHELNRVEFDKVRVPVANRIGEEGRAWHYANVLLANERLSYAHVGRKKADLDRLRSLARTTASGGGRMMDAEPGFMLRLARCEIDVAVLEISVLRALTEGAENATVSALKIACTEIAQRVTELYVELAGQHRGPMPARHDDDWQINTPGSPIFAAPATAAYLFERAQTIYGGATEVQKNIIWRQIAR